MPIRQLSLHESSFKPVFYFFIDDPVIRDCAFPAHSAAIVFSLGKTGINRYFFPGASIINSNSVSIQNPETHMRIGEAPALNQ